MKVLIIHNILWAHYKSALFQSISNNADPDTEVRVVHLAKNDITRKSMESAAFEYDYPYDVLFDKYIEELSFFEKFWKLLTYILAYKPDIINVTGYAVDPAISMSIFIGKVLGKKVILSTETSTTDNAKTFIKESIKKLFIKASDAFICFGSTSADYVLELGGKPNQIIEKRAAVVDDKTLLKQFNAAKEEGFKLSSPTPKHNFIFVGRLIDVKNLPFLFKVFAEIKQTEETAKDWGLIMLGDGDLKEELQKLRSDLKLEDVTFLPPVAWYDVPKYYTVADVLLLTSTSEAWGLVVNEAMVCGLPVIVSDKCGCHLDLINGNGFVFQSNDAVGLKIAILSLMKDEKLRTEMGQKSKEVIKNFSLDEVSKRILKGFKQYAS
jgi:glycosyltransferase involved in cell wall biosynthesis